MTCSKIPSPFESTVWVSISLPTWTGAFSSALAPGSRVATDAIMPPTFPPSTLTATMEERASPASSSPYSASAAPRCRRLFLDSRIVSFRARMWILPPIERLRLHVSSALADAGAPPDSNGQEDPSDQDSPVGPPEFPSFSRSGPISSTPQGAEDLRRSRVGPERGAGIALVDDRRAEDDHEVEVVVLVLAALGQPSEAGDAVDPGSEATAPAHRRLEQASDHEALTVPKPRRRAQGSRLEGGRRLLGARRADQVGRQIEVGLGDAGRHVERDHVVLGDEGANGHVHPELGEDGRGEQRARGRGGRRV